MENNMIIHEGKGKRIMENNMIIHDLMGKTFDAVTIDDYEGLGRNSIIFKSKDYSYILTPGGDSCADAWVDDIVGDLSNLEKSEIVKAEKRTNVSNVYDGREKKRVEVQRFYGKDIHWTFYEIATNKGSVTIRFCIGGEKKYLLEDGNTAYGIPLIPLEARERYFSDCLNQPDIRVKQI